jgi:hypothetical protein
MNFPKWLIVERAIIVLLVFTLVVRVIVYPPCLTPEPTTNPYDYRYFGGLETVIINCTWIGHPLANVTARLYTSNLTLINEERTSTNGLAIFNLTATDVFFVRLEYYAYFRAGGVEIYHRWLIFQGDSSSQDTFTLYLSLAPAIWPDEPPKL